QPFNDVAAAVVNAARSGRGEAPLSLAEIVKAGTIEYIDFPAALVGKYQCFTEADLGRVRGVGCDHACVAVEGGVARSAAALRAAPCPAARVNRTAAAAVTAGRRVVVTQAD